MGNPSAFWIAMLTTGVASSSNYLCEIFRQVVLMHTHFGLGIWTVHVL